MREDPAVEICLRAEEEAEEGREIGLEMVVILIVLGGLGEEV